MGYGRKPDDAVVNKQRGGASLGEKLQPDDDAWGLQRRSTLRTVSLR